MSPLPGTLYVPPGLDPCCCRLVSGTDAQIRVADAWICAADTWIRAANTRIHAADACLLRQHLDPSCCCLVHDADARIHAADACPLRQHLDLHCQCYPPKAAGPCLSLLVFFRGEEKNG
ncbi:hypothetical protein GUJ93_ZPchr0001g30428 [Zizania palustris]|uniref:Uncharacterized protein n=1 Tax=Zizania palustris TaxID=103762 RepID=A0A8J5VNM7_ZIZPA|nr:hypothetical protein GUJ93_ZPchr0001g30428 [Zizania palustris]